MVVAEIAGEVAGVFKIDASPRSRLRHIAILAISVRKKHWRKGVAAALMQCLLDWAKGNGIIRKINLSVLAHNEGAIALYERFGFEKEGLNPRGAIIEGEFFDAIAMGIAID